MLKKNSTFWAVMLLAVSAVTLQAQERPAPDTSVLNGKPVSAPKYAAGSMALMIELTEPPAAVAWTTARRGGAVADVADASGRTQRARTEQAQATVMAALRQRFPAARVLYRVQNAYDGIAVLGDAKMMAELMKLPGVKAIRVIPSVEPSNATSIPLIGTPQVWQSLGYTGAGMRVGVIDTGIDYTHTGLGGSGLSSDFTVAQSASSNPATTGSTYMPAFTVSNGISTIYPTAKVVGGWDFAGDAYTGANAPVPDPNPLDCNGHGSHVSGTIAGYGVNSNGSTFTGPWGNTVPFATMRIGPGNAPHAQLYALRVFGCSGSTNLVTQAIDWAMDPNGDNNLSDHLDVINMSLGSDFGTPDSPDAAAADNAAAAGVIVVVSAGNSGDVYFISGSPGSATRAVTVASSSDDTDVVDGFRVETPGPPTVYGATKSVAYNWTSPPAPLPSSVILYYPSTNQYGCSAWTGLDLTNINGRVVLVDWTKSGDSTFPCGSAARTSNAAAAGARGIIMVDAQPYSTASITGGASIPAMYTISTVGNALKANLTAGVVGSETVTMDASLSGKFFTAGLTDTVSSFTSRGPRGDSALKPDLAAVGAGVFSVASGTGSGGALLSGTSMAAPQIAGVMTLLKQMHSTWSVEELKALVMNSATRNLYTGLNSTGSVFGAGRVGAGRVSSSDAAGNSVVAYSTTGGGSVSVSFGALEVQGTLQADRSVTVSNKGSVAKNFTLAYLPVVSIPGVSFSFPGGTSISVGAGAATTFLLRLNADASLMKNSHDPTIATTQNSVPRHWLSEATGNITLTPTTGTSLRVPVYAAARPASNMTTSGTQLVLPADSSTATLTLAGTPINTGASFPNDYLSLVTPMELTVTSPLASLPAGATSFSRDADLKYVGVTAVRASPSSGSRLNNSTILFGIVTHGNWGTPSNEVEFDIYLDTNNDGTFDYALYESRVSGTDVLIDTLFNLATNATVANSSAFLNQFSSSTPTAPFNSNVIVMPLSASLLNMGSNTRFSYQIYSFGYGGQIDVTPVMSYDYASPGLDFNATGTGSVLYNDLPANTIPVAFNGPAYRLNQSKGALLLHHFNATGSREQVVPVACNTISVTNPAVVAATIGVPFNGSFTSSGGLGTVTYAVATGTLPSGLTLGTNGTLSGTPSQLGTFPVTVTATDGMGCSGTGTTYALVVAFGAPSITATAGSTTQITVTWSPVPTAATYQIFRKDHGGALVLIASQASTGYNDAGLSPAASYVYQVNAVDASNNVSTSNLDVATTIVFTDDPLVPGSTAVKSVHLTELRIAVNAMLVAAGRPTATFTDSSPAGVQIKAVHVTELRSSLQTARQVLGLATVVYTDPGLGTGSAVRGAHFQEVRNAVK